MPPDPKSMSVIEPFFTVAELVALPGLRGARVRAGAAAAAERQIRRASVQEVPLQDFVRPDELVMTTGMGLGDDLDAFAHFIDDVGDAGAAGLAVAVGYHLNEIPDALVERAEARGFPLIEFPWDLRFSEITETVLDRAIQRQHALLRESERLHELFTQIVLGGGSYQELCDSVSSLIVRPIAIDNRWGERIGTADGTSFAGEDAVEVPIVAGAYTLGTLRAGRVDRAFTESETVTLAHAATAAALILLIDEATDEARARDASEFVSIVLNRWSDSGQELEHWARRLGMDPKASVAVALGSFQWPGDVWDEQTSAAAKWAVERALSGRRTKALAMWQGPDVTLIIPVGPIATDEVVRILAEDVRTLVRRREHRACVTWGVGRLAEGLGAVAERYQDARVANRLGHAFQGHDAITSFSELGAFPALFEAVSHGRVAHVFGELQARYLDPVLNYERRTGLELTKTLKVFFAHNGNVSAAARELPLNRQSMIYRITKIEELTGVDLDDSGPRFALELALRSWELRVPGITTPPTLPDNMSVGGPRLSADSSGTS